MNAQKDFNGGQDNSAFGGFGAAPTDGTPGPTGGDFGGSSFGNTNAVSQLFTDNDAKAQKRKRIITWSILGGITLLASALMYMLSGDQTSLDVPPVATTPPPPVLASEPADDGEDEEMGTEEAPAPGVSTSFAYNAETGGPTIQATEGARIKVSRHADFKDIYVTGIAHKGQFQIPLPPPGKIYWMEEGGQALATPAAEATPPAAEAVPGTEAVEPTEPTAEVAKPVAVAGTVHEIEITPPESLKITFNPEPSLSAGASLSWAHAGGTPSYFKVEFAMDKDFANLKYSLSSEGGTSLNVDKVAPGQYFVRVGGLNRASGQWEFSKGFPISKN